MQFLLLLAVNLPSNCSQISLLLFMLLFSGWAIRQLQNKATAVGAQAVISQLQIIIFVLLDLNKTPTDFQFRFKVGFDLHSHNESLGSSGVSGGPWWTSPQSFQKLSFHLASCKTHCSNSNSNTPIKHSMFCLEFGLEFWFFLLLLSNKI